MPEFAKGGRLKRGATVLFNHQTNKLELCGDDGHGDDEPGTNLAGF
jgi:hypothetical protein